MITLFIDDTDLYKQGIILEEFDIGIPEMKVHKVSVPGRNGDLDMSRALTGYTHFSNRTISLVLGMTGSEEERERLRSLLFVHVYNKQVHIRFSHLEGYFVGTMTFHSYERTPAKSTIKATVDCYPFRLIGDEVVSSTTLTSAFQYITIGYAGMPTPLSIVTTGMATIEYKGKRYTVQKGEHQLGILLEMGNNTLRVSGNGTLTTQYIREVL
ncbi:hypothetical protein H1220_04265 [Carnobacteriaceae bacterium zg-84]|uniref:hypothetical protein n=1 Tax=Granulicatella sp. zg-84 TaxID=2678503 RepID=UPI0013C26E0F|nr:hypothetical protein [Granulicatella sp. zg-84]NEW66034.1 hypothetical protein [Granulicatella sp. zg-84]QMI86567.1 hypothetical protein H1220_04265 [Carnobacteriaceae bacterium zg-84]